MKKILLTLFIFLLSARASFALGCGPVNKAISNLGLSRDSVISYTIINNNTGETVCSRNKNLFLNPASSLKVLTMASALKALGEDYNFETVFYLDSNKDLYLKLGADPLFTSSDLDTLVKSLKKSYPGKIRNFYIDDSIIPVNYYPDGWATDDYWPNSPQISSYIIDKNFVKVNFQIQAQRESRHSYKGSKVPVINVVKISQNDPYRFSFINKLEIAETTKITPSLEYGNNSGIVILNGTISEDTERNYPVLDPQQFYTVRLRKALDKNGVSYAKPFYSKATPKGAMRIASFKRPIEEVLSHVLQTSDNFAAEVVFNVAFANWSNETTEYIKSAYFKDGSSPEGLDVKQGFELGKEMFFDYYKDLGVNTGKFNLVDASGVSRYNAVSSSIIANALHKLYSTSEIKKYMATPGIGTLQNRMRELDGNLRAKTGTIFGVSSLSGYVTSKEGVPYSFSIITQNFSVRPTLIKALEDDFVQGIYSLK